MGIALYGKSGKMLTQKGIVSTSDSMCAEAHEIMVKWKKMGDEEWGAGKVPTNKKSPHKWELEIGG